MFLKFADWRAAANVAMLQRWGLSLDDAGPSETDLRGFHYAHLTTGESVLACAEAYGHAYDLSDPDPMTMADLKRVHRIPADPGTYDGSEVDTALCVMDYFSEQRDTRNTPAPESFAARLNALWDDVGVGGIREEAARLGREIERIWRLAPEDSKDGGFAFDYEFVPAYLERCTIGDPKGAWRGSDYFNFMPEADALALVQAMTDDVNARAKAATGKAHD